MTILRVLLASWAIVGLWFVGAVIYHCCAVRRERRERDMR